MASKIILKKSSVADKAPVAGDLDFGELAINYTDSKLYFKKADGNIDAFTTAAASAPVTSVGGNIGDVTDAQLLASIKSVDGSGSGLDADLLDGNHASDFYLASNPNGYTSNTGTVTSVGATAPLVSSGGNTPSISIPAATASANGYMSSAYASKLDGIAAGATNVTNTNQLTNGAGYITSTALDSYLPLSGGTMTGNIAFASGNYNRPDALTISSDPNWTFGSSSDNSSQYFMQVKYYSGGTNNRAFRVLDTRTGSVNFLANDLGALVNGNQVLHAGNYSSYALPLNAPFTTAAAADIPFIFRKTSNGTNNGATLLVQNDYGTHSWGITGEFRVTGASDRPSILFSSDQTSTTWSVGYGYFDDQFRINQNHGHRNGSWGTERFRIDTSGNAFANVSMRSPIFYDSDNTAYYGDFASTSNLNALNVNSLNVGDGNLQLYKSQTVDLSNTSVYSESNFYPVIINVPTSGVWIEIQNNLNSNVPTWSTHGSGFTLNLRWCTNGSGWGTTEVKRRVEQYHERFTNQQICGGISQLGHSSNEVVWLRGGGSYFFKFSRNLTAVPQSSNYTIHDQTADVRTTAFNGIWDSATGSHTSYNTRFYADTAIHSPIYYDRDNTAYYVDPNSTSNLAGLTVANTITGSITGNAATATTLQTARTINGVSFNGSTNITVADSTKLPLAGGAMTGPITGTDASADAGALTVRGGNSSSSGVGGALSISGGNTVSTTAGKNGGTVTVKGGDNTSASGGFGAFLELPGGAGVVGSGGEAKLYSGDSKGTNNFGADLMLFAGRGTGTGVGGTIRFYTSGTTTSGTGLQNHTSRLEISNVGQIFARANIASSSTTTGTLRVTGGVGVSGTVYAAGFNGALTGNATTATTLQNARTINGTSFDGSANITTANWGTARTLTVGNTGKSVDGSANVAWSLAEIGAYAATNPSGYTSNTGTVTSVGGTGGYGGLTLSGTVTTSGNLTLGGTPTGTWPISVSGNAATASSTPNPTFSADAVGKDNITTRTETGFYESSTGTIAEGWPTDSGSWHHLIASTHSNDSNYYSLQLSSTFFDQQLYFRATNGSGSTAWNTVLHNNNFNSYAPTLTGTGASGTWGVSITGNAATASDSALLNGYASSASGGGNVVLRTASNGYLYVNNWIHPANGSGLFYDAGVHFYEVSNYMYSSTGFTAANDMRSPIFYDSNNTGYYVDPASTSVLNALTVNSINASSHAHDSINHLGRISAETGRNAHRSGVYTFSTFTAANPGGNPPLSYPEIIAWGAGGGGSIQLAGDWISTTSTPLRVRSLRDCCQDWSSWSVVATSNESFTNNVDLRAPIFYDSNDTSYYVNPNSGSRIYDLNIEGASNKYLYLNPGNGYEAMVRYNGGSGSGWYVGKRTASVLVGTESFHFYSEAAGATVGGVDTGGNIFASGSHRAPIFYDNNDTGYYADPNSTSRLNNVNANNGNWYGATYFYANRNTTSDSPALQAYSDNGSGAIMSFHRGGYYAVNFGLDSDNIMRIGGWSAATNRWQLDMSGNNWVAGSSRAPIFYDSQDTNYYADPNGTTRLNNLVVTGTVTGISGGQYFGTAATKAIAYNANSISENITVTTGNNGLSAGPITISSGFTVTVQSGAVWTVV